MPWHVQVWLVGPCRGGQVGAGPCGKGRGRLLMGVVGGRRVMKRMVKGRMPMKESSGKLGGGSCRIVRDFFFFFFFFFFCGGIRKKKGEKIFYLREEAGKMVKIEVG